MPDDSRRRRSLALVSSCAAASASRQRCRPSRNTVSDFWLYSWYSVNGFTAAASRNSASALAHLPLVLVRRREQIEVVHVVPVELRAGIFSAA